MKKILWLVYVAALFASSCFAEENKIDPFLMNTMQGGIAVESYLDGVYNESIGTVYLDTENKKIKYISIIEMPKLTGIDTKEPATLAMQIFDITSTNILEPKRISFTGMNESGYVFVADISALNNDRVLFYLKLSGRGIVEIKNISKKGLELKKKWAPGVYLGETSPQ